MSFDQVIAHYRNFKQIVPGKAEENKYLKNSSKTAVTTATKSLKKQQHKINQHTYNKKQHKNIGAPTRRLSKRKPTNSASWGGAPTKKCNKHFHGQSKLGWPQLGEVRSEIQQAKQAEIILRILLCIIFFHS